MSDDFSGYFSEDGFWRFIAKLSGVGELVHRAIRLYKVIRDPDVPEWAKALSIASLGYLICPLDAVPDVLPLVGLGDDAGIIAAAIASLVNYLPPPEEA